MEEKINKSYTISIVAVVLSIISLLVCFIMITNNSSKNNNVVEQKSDYDVSMMNNISLSELLKLFEYKDNTYVVYLGRESCSACTSFLPTLQSMQKKYNYITQYLDTSLVRSGTDDYDKFISKLSKKVTLTINGETKTQSFGEFYGYTPMVFIISKGKFVDGFVGSYSSAKFETFLNNNGIK